MSDNKKRHLTNVIASLFGYAVPMLVNFVSAPYLIRSLGEDAFGIQSLVNVIIGYLAIMDLGIGLPLIKYLAEDRAKGDTKSSSELLSTTLVLYSVLGLLGLVVAVGISNYLAEHFFSIPDHLISEAKSVFQLAAAGFFATLLMGWGRSVAMGVQRYEIAYAISSLSSVFGVGIGLFLIYSGFGVIGYVFSKVLFLFVAALVYFIIFRTLIPEYRIGLRFVKKTAISRIKSYLSYGVIHRGLTGLTGSIDKTLLGILVSTASVGLYSLPFMLTNSLNYGLSFMLSFIFPASSELYATGQHDRLRTLFMNSSRFLVAVACMVFLPLFLLGGAFLTLWLGDVTAGKVLAAFYLLALASFVQVLLTSLINCVMMGIGRIDQYTIYIAIRLAFFSCLCILLIPRFGIVGAAWGVLLSSIVDAIYFSFVIKKHLNIDCYSLLSFAYLKPLLISGCLASLFLPLHFMPGTWFGLLLSTAAIETVIMVSYYYFNVLMDNEKKLIKYSLNRGLMGLK